tara:strand:- start:156 stop:539 length:384 start_codon:yes stop_codon:yes gene_type:complete
VKWLITAFLIISAAGSCDSLQAKPSEWTKKERQLWHTYLTLSVVDTVQTFELIECQKHTWCDAYEMNPIIGSTPSKGKVVAVKLIGNSIIYKMLDNMEDDREFALKLMTGMQGMVVLHNGIYIYKRF